MDIENPVIKQIFNHKSVRRFDPIHEISRDQIEIIIKAGQQAATSCSGQTYTIIEILKSERESIIPLCGSQKFVADASFFCVICVDLYRLHKIVELSGGENQNWPLTGYTIGVFDAALVGQNMVLAAESLGYDTCFCGSCADKPVEMIEKLNLPPFVLPLTGLAIGKAIEAPPTRPRLPTSLIHHIGSYRSYNDEELENGIKFMNEKLLEEDYYRKYSGRENYFWRDHMRNKFGGKWLNSVEKRRVNGLIKQKFLKESS